LFEFLDERAVSGNAEFGENLSDVVGSYQGREVGGADGESGGVIRALGSKRDDAKPGTFVNCEVY
jgi:hypothetical protein